MIQIEFRAPTHCKSRQFAASTQKQLTTLYSGRCLNLWGAWEKAPHHRGRETQAAPANPLGATPGILIGLGVDIWLQRAAALTQNKSGLLIPTHRTSSLLTRHAFQSAHVLRKEPACVSTWGNFLCSPQCMTGHNLHASPPSPSFSSWLIVPAGEHAAPATHFAQKLFTPSFPFQASPATCSSRQMVIACSSHVSYAPVAPWSFRNPPRFGEDCIRYVLRRFRYTQATLRGLFTTPPQLSAPYHSQYHT